MPRYSITWTETTLAAGYIDAADEQDAITQFNLGNWQYEATLDQWNDEIKIIGKRD